MLNVFMDGVVREVNSWVLGKGLKLMSANNCGRFTINQLLNEDDRALAAEFCEFGRVF